ncbi:LysM peptidoglycan-binding domain-containing protein [Paenibacillus sp. JMULE4]|uniref:cell division suppressor protein YneA n=1 Tax=Paenibacillus sp. JMULE4 TaxID=2518342 RepID=UPI0020C60C5A|nr:LysM peptidoglycan-binding domain-containing protein [Paenibacillus sp. JMULE4]
MMIQNSRLIHKYHSRQVMLTKHNDNNNKGTYVRATVLGAFLFCAVFFISTMFSFFFDQDVHAASSQPQMYSYVEVESGDTLWSIASQYADQGQDIREYIHQIKGINHLKNSHLQVGQKLLLP